jgi:hypothetical protein
MGESTRLEAEERAEPMQRQSLLFFFLLPVEMKSNPINLCIKSYIKNIL